MTNTRRVLCINCGSSSLKFALYDITGTKAEQDTGTQETCIFSGEVERIGLSDTVFHVTDNVYHQPVREQIRLSNQTQALQHVLDWLESLGAGYQPDAIGHRVVHGGAHYSQPQRITDEDIAALRQLQPLAPVHLPAELDAIDTLRQRYPSLPQIACFDTAFHRQMPHIAQLYGLPRHYSEEGILRYGFHGLSYEYVLSELKRLQAKEAYSIAYEHIIIAHLGNGASMVAIRDEQSIDTTMGMTPIGGLVMGTRSGDLDPGVLLYLMERWQMSSAEVRAVVEQQGGLLGISETSSDMQDLLAHAPQDVRAEDAVALFCYNAKKHLGGLVSILGGITTLVFTGGIGEHAPEIRQRICAGLDFLGIQLDAARNDAGENIISPEKSPVTVRVIATNEELMIARHTARVVNL